MKKQTVTISDIAQRANVSKTTVSRYLNGRYEYMSDETRQNIKSIIEQLDYRPNVMAQSLKSKRSNLVAILLSDLGGQEISLQLKGLCDGFVESGYNPIIYQTYNSVEKEREYLQNCIDQQVDGILLIPSDTDFSEYERVVSTGIPVVLGDRYRSYWKYDGICIDHYSAVTTALNYLWQNGCTKIAFITEPSSPITTKFIRQNAFLDFAKNHYDFDGSQLLYFVDINKTGKAASMSDVIRCISQSYPAEKKAILTVTSTILYHALHEIQSQGIRIPDDLQVCGYNSWGWLSLLNENISLIEQPMYRLGRLGSELLVNRMLGKAPEEPQVISIPADFHPNQKI